ncbi:hypothetical protein BVG19_g531 [[Candida] boidinii]|nr:hypothetical protein BVG19_g531 [[Candida] boidinii]OWB48496.1 hypothetical protein B5S27_g31 [[Candida] boidinii]
MSLDHMSPSLQTGIQQRHEQEQVTEKISPTMINTQTFNQTPMQSHHTEIISQEGNTTTSPIEKPSDLKISTSRTTSSSNNSSNRPTPTERSFSNHSLLKLKSPRTSPTANHNFESPKTYRISRSSSSNNNQVGIHDYDYAESDIHQMSKPMSEEGSSSNEDDLLLTDSKKNKLIMNNSSIMIPIEEYNRIERLYTDSLIKSKDLIHENERLENEIISRENIIDLKSHKINELLNENKTIMKDLRIERESNDKEFKNWNEIKLNYEKKLDRFKSLINSTNNDNKNLEILQSNSIELFNEDLARQNESIEQLQKKILILEKENELEINSKMLIIDELEYFKDKANTLKVKIEHLNSNKFNDDDEENDYFNNNRIHSNNNLLFPPINSRFPSDETVLKRANSGLSASRVSSVTNPQITQGIEKNSENLIDKDKDEDFNSMAKKSASLADELKSLTMNNITNNDSTNSRISTNVKGHTRSLSHNVALETAPKSKKKQNRLSLQNYRQISVNSYFNGEGSENENALLKTKIEIESQSQKHKEEMFKLNFQLKSLQLQNEKLHSYIGFLLQKNKSTDDLSIFKDKKSDYEYSDAINIENAKLQLKTVIRSASAYPIRPLNNSNQKKKNHQHAQRSNNAKNRNRRIVSESYKENQSQSQNGKNGNKFDGLNTAEMIRASSSPNERNNFNDIEKANMNNRRVLQFNDGNNFNNGARFKFNDDNGSDDDYLINKDYGSTAAGARNFLNTHSDEDGEENEDTDNHVYFFKRRNMDDDDDEEGAIMEASATDSNYFDDYDDGEEDDEVNDLSFRLKSDRNNSRLGDIDYVEIGDSDYDEEDDYDYDYEDDGDDDGSNTPTDTSYQDGNHSLDVSYKFDMQKILSEKKRKRSKIFQHVPRRHLTRLTAFGSPSRNNNKHISGNDLAGEGGPSPGGNNDNVFASRNILNGHKKSTDRLVTKKRSYASYPNIMDRQLLIDSIKQQEEICRNLLKSLRMIWVPNVEYQNLHILNSALFPGSSFASSVYGSKLSNNSITGSVENKNNNNTNIQKQKNKNDIFRIVLPAEIQTINNRNMLIKQAQRNEILRKKKLQKLKEEEDEDEDDSDDDEDDDSDDEVE